MYHKVDQEQFVSLLNNVFAKLDPFLPFSLGSLATPRPQNSLAPPRPINALAKLPFTFSYL